MMGQRETTQREGTTMTVKTILATKGSEVTTIAPTATLEEAIAVLA